MSRTPTPQAPQIHHAVISRVYRQISVDKKLKDERRRKVLAALQVAMSELQAEMTK